MTLLTATPSLATEPLSVELEPTFVSRSVADAVNATPYSYDELFHLTAQFTAWCCTNGYPLERDVVFTEAVISDFIRRGLSAERYTDASRGNKRAQLRRMAEALLPTAAEKERLAPSDPRQPYSAADIATMRTWARAQPVERRMDIRCILALGLGAGLSASEIAALRCADIVVGGAGVEVHVRLGRVRTLPVRREWEKQLIARLADAHGDEYVVRPGRSGTPKNLISNVVDNATKSSSVRMNSQRLRATWLVERMSSGTPVKVLVKAAGVDSLEALTRYLDFVDDVSDEKAMTLLRS